jgi:hypothetical protein
MGAFGLAALAAPGSLALAGPAMGAGFRLTPHIPNHTPTVNRKWPITIDVTRARLKLSGSVRYQFMFGGTVVSAEKGHAFKHGIYTDQLLFPADSVGQPLTLRILVTVPKQGTEHMDWRVTPRR